MQMSPSRLMPSNSRDLMPQNDSEVVSSAVRLLRQGRTMLPKPRFRFLSVPEVGWAEGGELLGTCAAQLDAPDNSIVLVSIVEDGHDAVILPPADGRITISNNPMGVSVDAGIIDILRSVLGVTETSADMFDRTPWPYPLIPLVVEASRTRRRGTPVCTPVGVRGVSDELLTNLARTLMSIGTELKVGVVITRSTLTSAGTAWSLFERIVSQLSGSIEIIEGSGGIAYGGSSRRDH